MYILERLSVLNYTQMLDTSITIHAYFPLDLLYGQTLAGADGAITTTPNNTTVYGGTNLPGLF